VRENLLGLDKKLDGFISPLEGLSSSELPPLYCGLSSSLMSMIETGDFFSWRGATATYGALKDVPAGAIIDATLDTLFVLGTSRGLTGDDAGI
jgi:hypothetical protein